MPSPRAVAPDDDDRRPTGPPDDDGGGGDPVCWLSRVCATCGRLDDGPPPTRCPGCGAPLADD
jgi:hypothetical protein